MPGGFLGGFGVDGRTTTPPLVDQRQVTRGEVLAMRLAQRAGIDAAVARVVQVSGMAVAVITRFDRTADHARIPYLPSRREPTTGAKRV